MKKRRNPLRHETKKKSEYINIKRHYNKEVVIVGEREGSGKKMYERDKMHYKLNYKFTQFVVIWLIRGKIKIHCCLSASNSFSVS